MVSIHPGYDTQLISNDLVTMTIHIVNPDIVQYYHQPLTVSLGAASPQLMKFTSLVSGATCVARPANGREWVMQVNVSQNAPTDVVLVAKALDPSTHGRVHRTRFGDVSLSGLAECTAATCHDRLHD
jgi:hypothetical protein